MDDEFGGLQDVEIEWKCGYVDEHKMQRFWWKYRDNFDENMGIISMKIQRSVV